MKEEIPDQLNRIEGKLDRFDGQIRSIDITLASQHEILKDHIRRTELLEGAILPIQKHVQMIQGGVKLIVLFSTVSLALFEVIKLFQQ